MRDHERIEELIVASALDGLEPGEAADLDRAMAEHGVDCAECSRLQAEYADVAGRLALLADPVAPSEGFEDRVVGLATGSVAELRPGDRARGRSRGGVVLRPLVAVAAAVVLLAAGVGIGALALDGDGAGGGGTVPSDARVIAFEGDAPGSLQVAFRPGEEGVYILGSGLPAPPEGQVYEVWMIQGDTPVPGPCVTPNADGSLFRFVDVELGTTEVMAVTVESASCPSAPTSPPILTAQVTV